MIQLRDYQVRAKNKILNWVDEDDTQSVNTLVAPMAAGKTSISCTAIGELIEQGKRVWVVVDRIELLNQWHSELLKFNPGFDKSKLWFISSDKKPIYNRPLQFVQSQTLINRLAKVPSHLKPDVLIIDESHDVAFHRIITKLRNQWDVKQINLTATPVRHGSSQVQYTDLFPKKHWYNVITAKELIAGGNWKRPKWIVASEELALKTAIRFSGMKVTGGEYDSTAQSDVMIDLLPDHLKEALPLIDDRSAMWFVVDTNHALATYKALVALDYSVGFISGDDKVTCTNVELPSRKLHQTERAQIVELCDQGVIKHLITIQTAVKGFDCPVMSVAVWIRRTMSVGIWCQGSGRSLRKFEGVTEALMIDLAGNLALHPFPEDIDWWDFNPCKRLFRDPNLVVCKHCNHRHDAIPAPLHPTDRKLTFKVGLGCFDDGYELPIKSVLICHGCKAPVFADIDKLGSYALWLKCVASAIASGGKPQKFEGYTAGISIGLQENLSEIPLTIETMYELGIWKFSDGTRDKVANKDKSNEYNTLRIKLLKNLSSREVREMRFNNLSEKQQSYVVAHPVAEIENITDINGKYRTAICYAYVNDKSPIWSFKYWDGVGSPPKQEVIEALKSIHNSSPDAYDLLKDWIAEHLEKHTDQKHKGVCRSILKCLATLKPDEEIAA